jgi:hypothetical protein
MSKIAVAESSCVALCFIKHVLIKPYNKNPNPE